MIRFKTLIKISIDLGIFCVIFTNFILTHVLSSKSTQDILDSKEYYDLVEKSLEYKWVFILEAILVLLIIMKIIHVLTIIKAIRVIVKTITLAFKQVITYAFIILPLVVAYALIGLGVYGPFLKDYSTFSDSFESVLGFIVGKCDLPEMMKFNSTWTVIYVISLTMIVIYLIISSFSAILIDAYESTILSEGYPEGESDHKWTVKDAFLWMFDLLPKRVLEKIGLISKTERQQNIQADDEFEDDDDD